MKKIPLSFLVFFVCTAFASAMAYAQDPLPSWNDGPAQQAIIEFVKATTDTASPKFVPPEARIAAFDQDGTTWVEKPMYTQVMYCLERVPALAKVKPELKKVEPFKTVLSGDRAAMAKLTMPDLIKIAAATLTGMPVEQFNAEVKEWLAKAKDPRWKRPYTELVYQPMLEVMKYLRDNGSKTYIVTGGGQDFVRVYSEQVYGIPPEQVVGAAGATQCSSPPFSRPTPNPGSSGAWDPSDAGDDFRDCRADRPVAAGVFQHLTGGRHRLWPVALVGFFALVFDPLCPQRGRIPPPEDRTRGLLRRVEPPAQPVRHHRVPGRSGRAGGKPQPGDHSGQRFRRRHGFRSAGRGEQYGLRTAAALRAADPYRGYRCIRRGPRQCKRDRPARQQSPLLAGADIIVPNAQLVSDSVTDWTLSDQMRRVDLPVGVNYGATPRTVIGILESVALANPRIVKNPAPQGLMMEYGDSTINFELRAWTDNFQVWPQVRSDLAVAIYDAVRDAGMSFPFPQRDVHKRPTTVR